MVKFLRRKNPNIRIILITPSTVNERDWEDRS